MVLRAYAAQEAYIGKRICCGVARIKGYAKKSPTKIADNMRQTFEFDRGLKLTRHLPAAAPCILQLRL